MSDAENQDLEEFHDVEEEAIFIKKEITVDVEPITQNEVPADAEIEEEKSAQQADEDRTEDQVPDITGTEYVDPMTTSMDGIDELPVNEEAQITEESDAPVDESAEVQKEEAIAQEASIEEVQQEAPVQENTTVELPEDAAAPIDENVLAEQATPAETEAEIKDEPPVEENETPLIEDESATHGDYVEVPVESGEETIETVKDEPVEEEMAPPAVTPETTEAEKEFELQAPPEGKRPRTPNELDNPADDVPLEVEPDEQHVSIPPSPKTAGSEKTPSVPATPKSAGVSEIPSTPKSAVGSVPLTPKSAAGEAPQTPKSSAGGSVPPTPKSAMTNGGICNGSIPGTPGITKAETPTLATPAADSTPKATESPKSNVAFNFEETPATPKAESVVTFDDSVATPKTPKTPRTPRTPRTPKALKSPKTPIVEEKPLKESTPEPEPEPESEEMPEVQANGEVDEGEIIEQQETEIQENIVSAEDEKNITEDSEPYQPEEPEIKEIPKRERAVSPSPPPRARRSSPSPERIREHAPRDYVSYDQDSHRQVPPPRIPTVSSFSSWSPPEKQTYTPISPFVTNPNKYRNEYTASCNYRPSNTYTSHFDDIVNTGAFSSALYSTTRLIERSRSRTRERRQAMRSQRSASNYYRYTSQYPAPTRTREYSTPPSRAISRPPSRSGSFISFMEYSGAKNGELSRVNSRSSLYDSGLSRSSSRANVDMYVGSGRLSRVDSFVRDLHTPYEYEVPSTYERYRSASRPGAYSAINGYTSYTSSPSYIDSDTIRRMKRYQHDATPMIRSMYENRIGHLERSLSREKINKDRLRTEYSQLSNKLDQAMRQMDLLRSNSYSSLRSSSMPRTSVYSHFYPYY